MSLSTHAARLLSRGRRVCRHTLLRAAAFSLLLSIGADSAMTRPVFAGQRPADTLSAWFVEWDVNKGWEEVKAIGDSLYAIVAFASYFDANDNMFLNRRFQEWLDNEGLKSKYKNQLYLSVVNDMVYEDKPNVLKDPDLVSRLMATPESRALHRRALVELVRKGGYAGLEIDYERVKKKDWPQFVEFCGELYQDLAQHRLGLRVVLEPKKDYLSRPLPPGPDYVIMAYNLHGGHSGPGPKANPSFISRIASYCRSGKIEPRPRLALATGGFSWNSDGTVTSVTEEQAREMAVQSSAVLRRHPYSRYLAFTFVDTVADEDGNEQDITREVWFADADTFAHLVDAGRKAGFTRFDIWRLGGNSPSALAAFE